MGVNKGSQKITKIIIMIKRKRINTIPLLL